jgi:hypothetical protein
MRAANSLANGFFADFASFADKNRPDTHADPNIPLPSVLRPVAAAGEIQRQDHD